MCMCKIEKKKSSKLWANILQSHSRHNMHALLGCTTVVITCVVLTMTTTPGNASLTSVIRGFTAWRRVVVPHVFKMNRFDETNMLLSLCVVCVVCVCINLCTETNNTPT